MTHLVTFGRGGTEYDQTQPHGFSYHTSPPFLDGFCTGNLLRKRPPLSGRGIEFDTERRTDRHRGILSDNSSETLLT